MDQLEGSLGQVRARQCLAYRRLVGRLDRQYQPTLGFVGIDAQAPQRIQIDLDGMAPVAADYRIAMRESLAVETIGTQVRSHREARAQQPGQPDATYMFGQVHDQILVALPQ